jgi:Dihydrodipicolinate synthetase family
MEPIPPETLPPVAARRAALQARLFPEGIPRLWCPPLTHYTADGAVDRERQTAHLRFIARWAGAVLVPGSTGDGWELTDDETREVTDLVFAEARGLGLRVLAGALDPDAVRAAARITQTRARLTTSQADVVCGFAVCAPRGSDLTQDQIGAALVDLLSLGEPLALYQLPQITQNEMSPELVAALAGRFPEFVWFKDTSGRDAVTDAGVDVGGVFLVRGAEGAYARALKTEAGAYDVAALDRQLLRRRTRRHHRMVGRRPSRRGPPSLGPVGVAGGRDLRHRGGSDRRQRVRQRRQGRGPLLRARSRRPRGAPASIARGEPVAA